MDNECVTWSSTCVFTKENKLESFTIVNINYQVNEGNGAQLKNSVQLMAEFFAVT